MSFSLTPQYAAQLRRQYQKNLSRYPRIYQEVESYLLDKAEPFALCMQYLYGHMAAQDVLSQPVTVFAGYAQATLKATEQLAYVKNVPPDIFFPYVLQHRVNSECLDNSRGLLLESILPYVRGKSMAQAALAVNYWCAAHARYTPADDRTLGPLAILRRTLGRCGEESVLAVAALRSVGIPARQVYCPRWSHCDDNHAWVEVWIDGSWHYMGACEPEPVLDRGWFTAAASRAMLVDTKCWAGDGLYEIVNCTAHYTAIQTLTVQVTDGGLPVPGATVRFQVVNYSEIFTLWQALTDENGFARFETGPGDLFVSAQYGQKSALKKADLRQATSLTLPLEEGFPPYLAEDLIPPQDRSGTIPYADDPRHRELLALCQAHLDTRRAAPTDSEIQAFLADPRWPLGQKEEILSTLRPKDLVDITCETLIDALEEADAARGQYPADIFRDSILAPRIADEMLLPQRKQIRALFPQGFADPVQILAWMQANITLLPDQGVSNYYPSALECLRNRQVPAFAFPMVFVALCRTFRFPARLEKHTGKAQWLDDQGTWQNIHPTKDPVALTLELPIGKKLRYGEHISLGRWEGEDFATLQYPGLTLEGRHTFCLEPGAYRVTVTTRQIDGTASVALWHLPLSHDRTLAVTPPEDQTPQKLKAIPLDLPAGPLRQRTDREPGKKALLIFADPGSEPTEHLLREMLECAEGFRGTNCRILLMTETPEHPTVGLLKNALPETEVACLPDPEALAYLHRKMQVGDLRLPFVVCIDGCGRGVYADANYRIRMAQTLLDIQNLLA